MKALLLPAALLALACARPAAAQTTVPGATIPNTPGVSPMPRDPATNMPGTGNAQPGIVPAEPGVVVPGTGGVGAPGSVIAPEAGTGTGTGATTLPGTTRPRSIRRNGTRTQRP